MSESLLRQRFGQLLDMSGQMYWELARDYNVVYANRLLISVFGDPLGKRCFEFMADADHPCSECPVQSVFAGVERAVSERCRKTKDGRTVWHQHTATPIRNEAGELTGACELMIDTTQRKEMEGWLRDSERLYRSLVEEVPDVIFSLDADGRFAFVNTQIEKFLGYPVQEILETPLNDYVAPEDRTRLESMFRLQPEEIWDEEIGILDKDKNKKFARIRCKASFEDSGRPTGFDGVMRDRTVRRKLEEELKGSRQALVEKIKIIDELYEHIVQSGKCKAIEEHTAEVAHELRQPLAIIGGFARRMAKQLKAGKLIDSTRQSEYLGIIMSEIQRLERILDALIDFTRREQVNLQRIDPHNLIEYILGIIQTRAGEKRVHINTTFGSEIADIPVDPGRFQQLVLNLVANAIDASPYGGVVELETGASIPSEKALRTGQLDAETYFELKCRNRGPVIPEEDLQQIFNPFYTTKEHGTGLGLTVSKKIVEDHLGSISVKSDEEGTTFTVWLPLVEPENRTAPFCLMGSSPATN